MEVSQGLSLTSALIPLVIVLFIIAVGVVLLNQQFRKNLYRQQLKQEELKSRYQLDLLRSSIEVQEQERKRIALDLHDEMGATLSIMRMHLLQAEKQHGEKSEPLLADLKNIRSLTETSLANMRRISHELMPPQLESFGLEKTMVALAEQINKTGKLQLDLNFEAAMPELSWPVKLTLYRVFMELVNNTIKHANAQLISIELKYDGKNITAFYSDNGKGIDVNHLLGGIGHKSMEGRLRVLGGSLEMISEQDKGFKAIIKLPFV